MEKVIIFLKFKLVNTQNICRPFPNRLTSAYIRADDTSLLRKSLNA